MYYPRVKSVYLSFIVPRPLEGRLDQAADLATEEEAALAEDMGYSVSQEIRTTKKKGEQFCG